ncbi:MAG TPA: phosphopantetheine-binding protein [Arenicellales bacterium]|nr:phosphopantetheine-binding protein [Arenicellales bacterium]
MSDSKELEKQVMNVAHEVLTLEQRDDLLDASFTDDLSLSSLERMTLFIALEDEFGYDIAQSDVEHIDTLRGIIDFLAAKSGQETA